MRLDRCARDTDKCARDTDKCARDTGKCARDTGKCARDTGKCERGTSNWPNLTADSGSVESALVLIPLLILLTGIIHLYSFLNIRNAMELVAQGVAQSSIAMQNTVAAQFAAEQYLQKPGLPKFIGPSHLEVRVQDEQMTGFVIRKVSLIKPVNAKLINLLPLQVSATVILD